MDKQTRKPKQMESKTIQINDFELEVDYEIRYAEPDNGIDDGFDVHRVIIADCELFRDWERHFNIFKNDDWEDTVIDEISGLFFSEESYFLGAITGVKRFCNKPIGINDVFISQCVIQRKLILTYNLLKEHAKKIQDYLSEDMRNTEITEIIDHLTIEKELKDQL